MKIQDTRRARLAQLITERYGDSQARFVEETGENQGEISALLRSKSFGEKKARKIEAKCGLPAGWLDNESATGEAPPAERPPGATRRPLLSVVGTVEQEWMALVYLSRKELDLITNYRRATEIGAAMMEAAAETSPKKDLGTSAANQS